MRILHKQISLNNLRIKVRRMLRADNESDELLSVPDVLPLKQNYNDGLLDDILKVRNDITKDFVKELLLNERQYLADNPDVKNANLCPIHHYYNYGIFEGRNFSEPNFKSIKKADGLVDGIRVIFFDTIKSNASFLYRGFFQEKKDLTTIIIHKDSTFYDSMLAVFSAREIVFIRPSHASVRTKYFLKLCKVLDIVVTLDFDDLLLPDYIQYKGSVRSGVTPYYPMQRHLNKDSALLLAANRLVCSTQKIADVFSGFVEDISINKNKLPSEYFINKETVKNKVFCANGKVNILYLSGSRTHLKDYSLISGVLTKLAQNHADRFSLNLMGSLTDQTSVFSALNVQCDYIPYLDFDEMIKEIGKYDLVLVPLENTIFNNAKSNIKFIESASQCVPVIASSVDEYNSSIQHGHNGWLCDNDTEWYSTLEKIILTPHVLKDAGLNAYELALSEYSV